MPVSRQIALSSWGEAKETKREIRDLRTTSTSQILSLESSLIQVDYAITSKIRNLKDANKVSQHATAARSNGERLRSLEQSNAKNGGMLTSHFASLKITQNDRSRTYFTLEMQNLQAVVHPLLNLQPSLQKILSQITHGGTMAISQTDAKWLRAEFEDLLRSGHSATAEPRNEWRASAPPKWQLPDDRGAELGRKRSRPLDSNND